MSRGILGRLVLDGADSQEFEGVVKASAERLVQLLRAFERSYDGLPETDPAVKRTAIAWTGVQSLLGGSPTVV